MATATKRPTMSVPRARIIWEGHERRVRRDQLARFPVEVREKYKVLVEAAEWIWPGAWLAGDQDETRERGIMVQVKELVTKPGFPQRGTPGVASYVKHVRTLCTELAQHRALRPWRDGKLFHIDTQYVRCYNALVDYLVALEGVKS